MEDKNFQLRNLGIDKTKIYYIVPNDQEKKSQILSYNIIKVESYLWSKLNNLQKLNLS